MATAIKESFVLRPGVREREREKDKKLRKKAKVERDFVVVAGHSFLFVVLFQRLLFDFCLWIYSLIFPSFL